jgi:hypothetical protein
LPRRARRAILAGVLALLRIALASLVILVSGAPRASAVASLDASASACIATVSNCSVAGPGEGGAGTVFTGATGVGAQTSASVDSDSQIQISAGATQDYGVFRGRAQVIVDVPYSSPGTFFGGSGRGSARDVWTITSPGRSGPGTFKAFFSVDGSISSVPGPGPVTADLRLALTAGDPVYAVGSTGPIAAGGVYGFEGDASIPFTFGAAFPVEMASSFGASIAAPSNGVGFSSAVITDFSNGAYLSAIEVYDGQGQPVSEFAIATESGVAYPVPEPSARAAGALVCAALGAVAQMRRRA